jgi:hypothetical protein
LRDDMEWSSQNSVMHNGQERDQLSAGYDL